LVAAFPYNIVGGSPRGESVSFRSYVASAFASRNHYTNAVEVGSIV